MGMGSSEVTFMGASPLKDAPYLAAYEEAEIAATMINLPQRSRSGYARSCSTFF